MVQAYRARGKQRLQGGAQISYRGVYDGKAGSSADSRLANKIVNMYPVDVQNFDEWRGRPGVLHYADWGAVAGFPWGDFPIQGIQFISRGPASAQPSAVCVVADSEFWVSEDGGTNWTRRVATSAITGAGLTDPSTVYVAPRIYTVEFGDHIVVQDNVNGPWMFHKWTGAITVLTNAPDAYGQPVVYYAKLFFIVRNAFTSPPAPTNEIMWSEEGDATTGYDQGGFNNAWELRQTSQDPIQVLWPTNDALYYFRQSSVGSILGSVTTDFQSTGVLEAVSQHVGCVSPDGVIQVGDWIWFSDAEGRLHRFYRGGVSQSNTFAAGSREMVKEIVDRKGFVKLIYRPDLNVVQQVCDFVGAGVVASGYFQRWLNYNPDDGSYLGYYDSRTLDCTVVAVENDRDYRQSPTTTQGFDTTNPLKKVFHGNKYGVLYYHTYPSEDIYHDESETRASPTEVPIRHEIRGSPLYWDMEQEKFFDRVDLSFGVPPGAQDGYSDVEFSWETPYGGSAGLSVVPNWLGRFDVSRFDAAAFDYAIVDLKKSVGMRTPGRFVVPRIVHDPDTPEQFAFVGLRLWGYGITEIPEIR